MTTIACDVPTFNRRAARFHTLIGDKRNKPETIQGAWRGLALSYLGLKGTESEIETAASFLQIMEQGATARGWILP